MEPASASAYSKESTTLPATAVVTRDKMERVAANDGTENVDIPADDGDLVARKAAAFLALNDEEDFAEPRRDSGTTTENTAGMGTVHVSVMRAVEEDLVTHGALPNAEKKAQTPRLEGIPSKRATRYCLIDEDADLLKNAARNEEGLDDNLAKIVALRSQGIALTNEGELAADAITRYPSPVTVGVEQPRLSRQQPVQRDSQPGAFSEGGPGGEEPARRETVASSAVGVQAESEALESGLAEARPVSDDIVGGEAQQVDMELIQKKEEEQQRRKKIRLVGFVSWALCCVILAIALGISFSRTNNDAHVGNSLRHPLSTAAPSTGAPTPAPTGALDKLFLDLPSHTLERLQNSSVSPQWLAWDWLMNHPDVLGMQEWRKKQLFAMGTFFYAMSGTAWPLPIQQNWMLYDQSECNWFSSQFGSFLGGNWAGSNNKTVCTEDGELHVLHLDGLATENAFIPPEISLLTSLSELKLPDTSLEGPIEPHIFQMTHLTMLDFGRNSLNGSIPHAFGSLSNLISLKLEKNSFTGSVPTQLGLLTKMTHMWLHRNSLTGPLHTEIGLMSSMTSLVLYDNMLSGQLPTELGLFSKLERLDLDSNRFTGTVVTEMGLMTSMQYLDLDENRLTGPIPTQTGLMTSLLHLDLFKNQLSGEIPSEIGLLSSLSFLWLHNNTLSGTLPLQLNNLVLNGSLVMLNLDHNILESTVSNELCLLGLRDDIGLSFDCTEQTCGCCWCPCPGSANHTNCSGSLEAVYVPSEKDSEWPGVFPVPLDTPNIITINMRTDDYPQETTMRWSIKDEQHDSWKLLDSTKPSLDHNALHSYTKQVESNSTYRLRILDSAFDGICCNKYGLGWFTITNSTPSKGYTNGTVVWEAPGEFDFSLDVYLAIDESGQAQLVDAVKTDSVATAESITEEEDPQWPGAFPKTSNSIVINVRTDDFPDQTSLEWSRQNHSGLWESIDTMLPHAHHNSLFSYTQEVESNAIYRLSIQDSEGDGTCCGLGFGWFTITNSTPSSDYMDGTVLWKTPGIVFDYLLDVFFWVDEDGRTHQVEYLPGEGFALAPEGLVSEEPPIIVKPEAAYNSSSVQATPAPRHLRLPAE